MKRRTGRNGFRVVEKTPGKISSRLLLFRNPYYTTGRKQQLYSTYRSPIHRTGITSLEAEEQQRAIEKIQQLKNAGLYDDDDDAWFNMTFKDFGDTVSFPLDKSLPQGVTNVEEAEKLQSAARQIEARRAGVLSAKDTKLRQLYKILQKRQQEELKRKAIQYLAETDELDQIPEEYAEEVQSYYFAGLPLKYRKYYNTERGSWLTDADARARGMSPAELAELQIVRQTFGQDLNKIQDRQNLYNRVMEKRRERAKKERRLSGLLTQDLVDQYYIDHPEHRARVSGHGSINGWRAPRLHNLVRPIHSFDRVMKNLPEDIIETQKEQDASRKDEYRDMQKYQRGVAPPKEMVNRAMPKTAEPLGDNVDVAPEKEITRSAVMHPFVFPTRRFAVVPL